MSGVPLQHVFIDGKLTAFSELPSVYPDEQLFPGVYHQRRSLFWLLAAAVVLVALAVYWLTH
jgi:hypothetical protein